MREITQIVVHGAWTKSGVDVGVAEIREWHLERNFRDIGYHHVIRRNGQVEAGRPEDQPGAHVEGHNKHSVGICLVGGREDDNVGTAGLEEHVKQEILWEFNYTSHQMRALDYLVETLLSRFPGAEVLGHRDFPGVVKRCPGFDVRAYFS